MTINQRTKLQGLTNEREGRERREESNRQIIQKIKEKMQGIRAPQFHHSLAFTKTNHGTQTKPTGMNRQAKKPPTK